MSLPPLYALRAFETAARLGSFSQAALTLHVTPGAISRHIRTLEAWFDCELFKRKGPKVEITPAGRMLAGQLQGGFQSLERACAAFLSQSHQLRLKAPSTLTMRWLLDVLNEFRQQHATPLIEITSVWMDRDSIDFIKEPYDCAILLGSGHFGAATESRLLFAEWLIPLCSPAMAQHAQRKLTDCELIHPSPDRRDWRRWLQQTKQYPELDLSGGKVFDMLEQGNMAAIRGHGISVGDLLLSLEAINTGLLALPFKQAVATGEGYYLVWPKDSPRQQNIELLHSHLTRNVPIDLPSDLTFIGHAPPHS